MKRQDGFVLATALMILVAMTLIGIALVRAVDTTNAVATNIAFKHSTLNSTDIGTEEALAWLEANKISLTNDQPGYYARSPEVLAGALPVDYTGQVTPGDSGDDVDWDGTGSGPVKAKLVTSADAAGNQVAYVIHRLCDTYGTPGGTSINCAKMALSLSSGGSKGGGGYGTYPITSKTQVYYRITARALGPRNTVTYAQSLAVMEY